MTVFLSPLDWWSDADLGATSRDALDKDRITFVGATPFKINFCRKGGGTFILKFWRKDLDLDGVNELAVAGNLNTKNGDIAFEGSDSVRVKNADYAGEKGGKSAHSDEEDDNGNHDTAIGLKKGNGHGNK
jgi:hypothetical protein